MAFILPTQIGTPQGELLFRKSEEITDLNEGIKIINSLRETLDFYGGVGLAAPQIGISKKVFIVNLQPAKDDSDLPDVGFKAYINPEILNVSTETNVYAEGCLSVFYATLYGSVIRPDCLKIKYLDIKGKQHIDEIYHPFHARVILHENDHLNGKIFLQLIKTEDFSQLHWNEDLDIRKK
ncbi:MAG: peptide deformylase [Syntrophaceae bacterium]|nr:peptide deformylase [Syntrophaceae bacterium]